MSEEAQSDGSKSHPEQDAAAALLADLVPDAVPDSGPGSEPGARAHDACTTVSQTMLGQMTGGAAPEPPRWSCEVCTYDNFAQSRKCTMCRSEKPALGEDIYRLQAGAAALPQPDDCDAEAVSARLRPLRISSPAERAPERHNKWPCATCTYENWPKSLKCAMCGAPPPPPGPAPSAGAERRAKPCAGINEVVGAQAVDKRRNNTDWVWLQACLGVVDGDARCVEAYLASGGDPARALTTGEAALLDRASAFDAGHTLVHLAIRFQRQEILSTLLSRISGGGPGLKRSPSYVAPDLAAAIRRHMASCIRFKKGTFSCKYINEVATFCLPAEIEELPPAVQEQLFSELLDRDVQHTLEEDEPPLINWSPELTRTLGSRLYALWNRSAGDCLPDAVCQSAYGVFDRHNALRAALCDTLHAAHRSFFERWARWERAQAAELQYVADDSQLLAEWQRLLAAAQRPQAALRQLHVFALAHVMRRPLLVYGVDVVHSFRGEPLGRANFQGIYLPLLWEPSCCSASPLCLGYTRGHFSALVPLEPYAPRYICREQSEENEDVTYLPLTDSEGKLLPVHFLNCDEMSDCEGTVRRWTSACVTRGGVLCARQRLSARPLLQAQLLEEWLNHYRRAAQQSRGPFPPRLPGAEYSSDADTDDE